MLGRRREAEIVPSYSLTGDLLSFLRCGLQYRYQNGSSLPPSRPVQMWFGEFIHGVMESAYRAWCDSTLPFPWPCNPRSHLHSPPPVSCVDHDIGSIGHVVEVTLHAAGMSPRSRNLRDSAYRRAEAAVNELGPVLFPLIISAEEKVIGTRPLPSTNRARMYELHGVMDVLSAMTVAETRGNFLCDAVVRAVESMPRTSHVIVDYKGSRRPAANTADWDQGTWQVQMYAWLRKRQPDTLPVSAGILLYVNELAPGQSDIEALKAESQHRSTDVLPVPGSPDDYLLRTWRRGDAVPRLSRELRIARMIRVVPVTPPSMDRATAEFDDVVTRIEAAAAAEAASGRISGNWEPCGDDKTCAACDYRYFCPSPATKRHDKNYVPKAPEAP